MHTKNITLIANLVNTLMLSSYIFMHIHMLLHFPSCALELLLLTGFKSVQWIGGSFGNAAGSCQRRFAELWFAIQVLNFVASALDESSHVFKRNVAAWSTSSRKSTSSSLLSSSTAKSTATLPSALFASALGTGNMFGNGSGIAALGTDLPSASLVSASSVFRFNGICFPFPSFLLSSKPLLVAIALRLSEKCKRTAT